MAREIHSESVIIREYVDKYITDKIRHHVKYFALESASLKSVWVIKSMDLREIVRTVSDERLCKLFRITGSAVHLMKQTYENTRVIEIAPIIKAYGVILDKEERQGNYNEGEMQVTDMFEGKHTGSKKGHWKDVSANIGGKTCGIEVKCVGGWMEENEKHPKKKK